MSSTGIGLKTCTKIIEMHNGKLSTQKIDNFFIVTITLDVK